MKKIIGLWMAICFVGVQLQAATGLMLFDLRCENLADPLAIDNTSPHFSWKMKSGMPAQESYEMQVASDSLLLVKGEADLWKSGRIRSSHSVMVPYGGKALHPRMLCYWRVRVWDSRDGASPWSAVQRFGIGTLPEAPLQGAYIGLAEGDVRAPLLRKSFAVEAIETTLLHVNSLGYHEVYLNGRKVSDAVLSPAVSQLGKRSLVVTYDVTPYLHLGQNDLVLWLGQGWYKKTTFGVEHDGPVVKAEMAVRQADGWHTILTTDSTWTGRKSGYSDTGTWQALRFGGERIDARLMPENLGTAALDRLEWHPAAVLPITTHQVSPQMCEPNCIQEVLTPKNIEPLGNDVWLVDMGRVLTGWFELHLPPTTAGHEVTVSYSDYMTPDGRIEEQGESDVYVASGKTGGDTFCNKFNHHAFRYAKISNLPFRPTPKQIKGYLIHGDYASASTFCCSDNDLNAIHDMIKYTIGCLTSEGYQVDCPHLERAGYGGDGNSSTNTSQTMYDLAPTYLNWLQAWHDSMRDGGSLPHVGPNPGAGGGGPYWCGFVVMAPWRTYVNYGDPRLMERYYDTMKEWMKYVARYTVKGLLKRWPDLPYRDWYLGDWLAPAGVDAGAQSSVDLVNNCFISDCLGTLQKIATALGREEEARQYGEHKTSLNRLIHQTFFDASKGIYATGSQLDMSYPMLVGAVPEALYERIKEKLIERSAHEYKGHIAVGLVGVPILTDWAIRNGEADFMYRMLKQPDYPGYLYMLRHNATTTWEYWSGERSRVHNCYNGIGTWFYQAVGGIRPDEAQPGYRHVFIEPQVPQGVTWARTTRETPYGPLLVDWKLKDSTMKLHVVIPTGATADVKVPRKTTQTTVNGKELEMSSKETIVLHAGSYDISLVGAF